MYKLIHNNNNKNLSQQNTQMLTKESVTMVNIHCHQEEAEKYLGVELHAWLSLGEHFWGRLIKLVEKNDLERLFKRLAAQKE